LAARKKNLISPEWRGDDQRNVDEPGRRNKHTTRGQNPETSELTDCNLLKLVFDMMIAVPYAPANHAQGWPLGYKVLAMKLHNFGAPRALLNQNA
jgi:hypothetical protein